MFGKLLKHEFHATGRFALPLCGMMLALAVLSGLVLRFWGDLPSGGFSTAGNAIIILYGMSLFAVAVGIFVILMQRFKQNFFGNEGYLTRTLPVSEHGLLLSKLLVAVCWYIAAGVLMMLSMAIAGGLTGEFTWSDMSDVMDALRYHLLRVNAGVWVYTILATLGGALFVTLLFYAISTISQNFRKHKFLYYVMILVIAVILLRLLSFINLALDGMFQDMMYQTNSSVGIIGGADGPTAIYVTGSAHWVGLIELYLSDVVLYFLTWAFLKFRPNLE